MIEIAISRLESFADIDIVRACVDSNSFPCFFQYLEYHLRSASLPIRSCDMDGLEGILWVVEILTCASNFFESIIIRRL